MFIIRQFLLQIIVPVTVVAIVALVLLQIIHWTVFSPQWYKDNLRQSGVYEQISPAGKLPTWLQPLVGGGSSGEVIQNQVEKAIDDTADVIKSDKPVTVPATLTVLVSGNQQKSLQDTLSAIRGVYRATKTALFALYIIVPVAAVIMIWLLIQELVSLLKMVFNVTVASGLLLLLGGGLGKLFPQQIIDFVVPDSWQALANFDVVNHVLLRLVEGALQIVLVIGGTSVGVAWVVWFVLHSLQHKPKSPSKDIHPPMPPMAPAGPEGATLVNQPISNGYPPPNAN